MKESYKQYSRNEDKEETNTYYRESTKPKISYLRRATESISLRQI